MPDYVSKITYVDARYSYEPVVHLNTPLPLREAYGYLEERADCFILAFIKSISPKSGVDDTARMGLILPKGSIISTTRPVATLVFPNISPGTRVALVWQDVVLFESTDRRDCSIMYTEGILLDKNNDNVVIQSPQTIRTYPAPVTNHPGGIPTFLRVPLGMIKSVEAISKTPHSDR